MTEYNLDNLPMLTENHSIGKIVTAGFWESDAIAELLEFKPQQLIILEPEHNSYAAISANFADNASVKVLNSTLADKNGQVDYYLFRPDRFSSLIKPKHLLKIYKKNNTEKVISVNANTVQTFCEQENLVSSAGNILLLSANCAASIVFDSTPPQALKLFDVIVVRQPKPDLYKIDEQKEAVKTKLEMHHFSLVQERVGDAMFTQLVFVRNYQLETLNALDAKIKETEDKNAEITTQLAEAIAFSEQLKTSAKELKTVNAKLKTEHAQKTEEIEKLCADSEAKKTENQKLASQVDALQSKNKELIENQKNKDATIADLTKQRDLQTYAHQESKQREEALKTQNEKFSLDNAAKQTEIERLVGEVGAVQAKNNELVANQKNKNARIAELTEQIEKQTHAHQESKQREEALKTQNEKFSLDNAAKQTEIERLVEEVGALQAKNNELVANQKNKNARIAELTEQLEKQMHAHQESKQREEALKTQNEKFSLDNAAKQTEIERLVGEVGAVQAKNNELVANQKNKNARIAELTEQLEKQMHAHQESKQREEALKTQNEKFSLDNAAKQTEIERLVGEVGAVQAKNNELVANQKNKNARIAELTEQLEKQTHVHQESKQREEALKTQNEKFSLDNAAKQTEIERLVGEVGAVQAKNNELIDSQKAKDAHIESISGQRENEIKLHQEHKDFTVALKVEKEQLINLNTQLKNKSNEYEARVSQLESDKQELINRQTMLDNEIVKAEAQIELIKDVVLREKAF